MRYEKILPVSAFAGHDRDHRSPFYSTMTNTPETGPDFLCVGAQKAGTTWLYSNLARHPKVFVPPIKEIAYFSALYLPGWSKDDIAHRAVQVSEAREFWTSTETLKTRQISIEKAQQVNSTLDILSEENLNDEGYLRIFASASADQLRGELSPQYCVLPREGIRHALKLNPNLKVIVLLRHPVDRAMSHIAMLCGASPTSERMKEIAQSGWWEGVSWYSDYATWLLRWQGMLPPGQLHVDYNGLIRDDPSGVLRRICDFLGLPYAESLFRHAAQRVFEGARPEGDTSEVRAIVSAKLAPLIEDLQHRLPDLAVALERHG